MLSFLSKIFPSKSEKDLRKILPLVDRINELFEGFSGLSDDQMREKTQEFRSRIAAAVAEDRDRIAGLKKELQDPGLDAAGREALWNEIEENQSEIDRATREILDEILPARIGHTWAARVRVIAPVGSVPFTALFTSGAAIVPQASPYGEILIDPALRMGGPSMAEGSYTFAIPPDTALIGFQLFAQAAVLPPVAPRPFLTNALSIRVGY